MGKKYLQTMYMIKELKMYIHTKTCTWMFTEVVFIFGKTWKKPRCLLVGEWVKYIMVHPDKGILFSTKKK